MINKKIFKQTNFVSEENQHTDKKIENSINKKIINQNSLLTEINKKRNSTKRGLFLDVDNNCTDFPSHKTPSPVVVKNDIRDNLNEELAQVVKIQGNLLHPTVQSFKAQMELKAGQKRLFFTFKDKLKGLVKSVEEKIKLDTLSLESSDR